MYHIFAVGKFKDASVSIWKENKSTTIVPSNAPLLTVVIVTGVVSDQFIKGISMASFFRVGREGIFCNRKSLSQISHERCLIEKYFNGFPKLKLT